MADAEDQVEYFLRLGMATTAQEITGPVRERVTLLAIEDRSSRWLSEKLVDREHQDAIAVRERLRDIVEFEYRGGRQVMLASFEPSRTLEDFADRLGVGTDQAPSWAIPWGTKTAGRELFRSLDIPVATASGLAMSVDELADALVPLVRAGHRRFVLKLDSTEFAGAGLGNALFEVDHGTAAAADLSSAITASLPQAAPIDPELDWPGFVAALAKSGVLAEELLTGDEFRSPSFQGRLTPDGPRAVSTHEQLLAANGQTYLGCTFPAAESYRALLVEYGLSVGKALCDKGIERGDYGVDFIAVVREGRWFVYGCEVNMRATGTRHGFDLSTTLLGVTPDADGELRVGGERRVCLTADSIVSDRYRALRPRDLIAAVERSPLHYDPIRKQGVVLHLLSALPAYGKFGAVCVADRPETAHQLLADLRVLADKACGTAASAVSEINTADGDHLP
ncbi:peptide ligase PGM1-related protein [Nocardia nepalensis]|uniref:peptide ligase PGM1-related protein n=1 Tax=Nocardia nepalensis TaxID=3375448 RepID=UPI003B680863